MTKYKYKFSVIIPIYNVEEYLEETILSVVNQTIGFENNIQLILVNDGSPDNSEEICLKYKKLYPDNIVYVKQKNGGVSSARNKGMGYIEGEFVNFLDSDDIWSKDVMHEIYNQHRRHPHIKLFSCRMRFFDMVKGNHPLNYKYTHNKIINIMEEYEYPQLSSSSIFIKTTALKNHKYDSTIKYSEDNKFINEIIFEQGKYMVLKKPTYYYRRRQNLKSAIQNQIDDRSYYFVTPEKVYNYLFELSKEKFGRVIEYIQYLVMYEINWRTNANATKVLDKSENKKYASLMRNLLSNIDPDIIMSVRNADLAKKVYMYDLKKKGNCIDNINYEEGKMKLFDLEITSENLGYLIIDTIYFKNNKMYLYGKLDTKFVPKNKFTVKVNNKIQKPKFYDLTNDYDESSFDGTKLHSYVGISFELKVEPTAKINFFFSEFLLTPRFKRNSVFYERMPRSYHRYNKKLVYYDKEKKKLGLLMIVMLKDLFMKLEI